MLAFLAGNRSCHSHLLCQCTGSFSLATSIHSSAQSYHEATITQRCWHYSFYTSSDWPKFAYVTNPVPPGTRCVTYKLHPQRCSCFCSFLYFWHSTHKTHSHSFWTLRLAILLVTSPSFSCCYERNSFHTASLFAFHFSRPAYHLFFIQLGMVARFT